MPLALPAGELLRLAASVDRSRGHPLGAALVRTPSGRGCPRGRCPVFASRTGRGVVGSVVGPAVAVGNRAFLEELGADPGPLAAEADRLAAEGQTPCSSRWTARPPGSSP